MVSFSRARTVSPVSCAALVQPSVGNRISHEYLPCACSWRLAREDDLQTPSPSQTPKALPGPSHNMAAGQREPLWLGLARLGPLLWGTGQEWETHLAESN